jgi:hypothetical protein
VKLPKHAEIWLPGYLKARWASAGRRSREATTTDILFCIADHFEPDHGAAPPELQRARVARWTREYPALGAFRDSDGCSPRHTFFTPLEVYREEIVDALGALCAQGFGEVEVHLHHAHDTSHDLRARLIWFRDTLASRHGLLGRGPSGQPVYGFVHGNWALDNGGVDASTCGVNDELTILEQTGCFADFTMPAAPECAQSRVVNQIYYAEDDPNRSRSYDRGVRMKVGSSSQAGLLICEGPLMLNWSRRVRGVLPRLETGTLDASPLNRPTVDRFRRWVGAGISIEGRPEWIFVKVHSHGAKEANADVMLGSVMKAFHRDVLAEFNDGRRYRLHYVTARELYNIAKAAEAGKSGNAGEYRDFLLTPPPFTPACESGDALLRAEHRAPALVP